MMVCTNVPDPQLFDKHYICTVQGIIKPPYEHLLADYVSIILRIIDRLNDSIIGSVV